MVYGNCFNDFVSGTRVAIKSHKFKKTVIVSFAFDDCSIRIAALRAILPNAHFVRIAEIYVFSRKGTVWIILLFKKLYIDVSGYQPCREEELL